MNYLHFCCIFVVHIKHLASPSKTTWKIKVQIVYIYHNNGQDSLTTIISFTNKPSNSIDCSSDNSDKACIQWALSSHNSTSLILKILSHTVRHTSYFNINTKNLEYLITSAWLGKQEFNFSIMYYPVSTPESSCGWSAVVKVGIFLLSDTCSILPGVGWSMRITRRSTRCSIKLGTES